MYNIIFYKDKKGNSDVLNYLMELKEKAKTDKDARINREKIIAYMNALSDHGTRIGKPIVKHIEDNIWELRPLKNRIFFFYWKDNTFVMLHHFIKKTPKIPPQEKEIARKRLKDFKERNGD